MSKPVEPDRVRKSLKTKECEHMIFEIGFFAACQPTEQPWQTALMLHRTFEHRGISQFLVSRMLYETSSEEKKTGRRRKTSVRRMLVDHKNVTLGCDDLI